MNFRVASREEWDASHTVEHINAGSLQRIADATEKMAQNYDDMRENRDFWKTIAERRATTITELQRSNRGLRGVITKLKKRLVP